MMELTRSIDRQRIDIIVITLCLTIAVAVTYGSFISSAKSMNEHKSVYKYYTSIQIQAGDTLWGLADDYISEEYHSMNDYISEVKQLNSLETDDIHAGEYLTIPYYSDIALD